MDHNDIRSFIRSRAPLFFVSSHEEKRVESALKKIAAEEKMKFFSWSFAALVTGEDVKVFNKDNMVDLNDLLQQIISEKDSSMIVLKDVGRVIKNQDPEPALIRRIKEFVINYQYYTTSGSQHKYKPIIMIDSSFSIPHELEKEAVVIDYDLITQPEIVDYLKSAEDSSVTFKDKDRIASNLLGLTDSEILNVVGYLYQAKKTDPSIDLMKMVKDQKKQQIQKSEFLEYIAEEDTFDCVGGMDLLKDWLRKRHLAFSDKAIKYGLKKARGVLLVGSPGSGKSLSAKSIANMWGVPLIRFDIGKLFNSLVGSSERATRSALKTIDSIGNCVVWIDEIEKGMAGMHSSSQSDAGTTARVIGTILTWLQERPDSGSFIVATANGIKNLPPELLRKGRFSEIFYIAIPTFNEREDILKIQLSKINRKWENFDLKILSKHSDKMVGAEIEEAISSALFESFADDKEINTDYIVSELQKIVPLSVSMADQLSELWKWCLEGKARFSSSETKKAAAANIGFKIDGVSNTSPEEIHVSGT